MIRRLTIIALVALVALASGCAKKKPPPPRPAPSYDKRELPAIKGEGSTISDAWAAVDSGIHVSDAEASLFDEELCNQACSHLFDVLLDEQREALADDTKALELFEQDLDKIRKSRMKRCLRDCRRYADHAMVQCVLAAGDREALDSCDF